MIDLRLGDCIEILQTLKDNSVDSVVCDPPYHLTSTKGGNKGFMGKEWDGGDIAFRTDVWKECLRVLKPGGYLLAFSSSRTYHRIAVAVEDTGFDIRDQIMWIYGQGFPKSHNIGKKVEGYEGWGTALKPAHEPIVMARKPLSEKSVAENVIKWGTGGINIDESRIGYSTEDKDKINFDRPRVREKNPDWVYDLGITWEDPDVKEYNTEGRFPANVMFDEEAGKLLDEQSGKSKTTKRTNFKKNNTIWQDKDDDGNTMSGGYDDEGGASRFFYCPKASKKEKGIGNTHPTIKPLELMTYLIKLITRPGGVVLDCFMGSGSTGVAAKRNGFGFIGVEKEQEYFDIAQQRIDYEN